MTRPCHDFLLCRLTLLCLLFGASTACSEAVGSGEATTPASSAASGGGLLDGGIELRFAVPSDRPVYIDLDEPSVVDKEGAATLDWELAFQGFDIFTNSGVSGAGLGGAFGPLDPPVFLLDEVAVPFVQEDETGGAFLRWYAYEGEVHALWSRYYIYGVKSPSGLYKVQVVNYYGKVQGAPVSAVYQLRWAAVDDKGNGPTTVVVDLDGTAGGLSGGPSDPSGCIALATGERLMLTPAEALKSTSWDLCFRRDSIRVNGELGGPAGVIAANLSLHEQPQELPVDEVKDKTAAGELAAFDAVDFARLTQDSLTYRGDRIVSAFGTGWYSLESGLAKPAEYTWLVQTSDGARTYLVYFDGFEGAESGSPGVVTMRIKPVVKGELR